MKDMKIMKGKEFSHHNIMYGFNAVIFKPFMVFMVKISAISDLTPSELCVHEIWQSRNN
jgi:hypothetical protein